VPTLEELPGSDWARVRGESIYLYEGYSARAEAEVTRAER